MLTPRNAILLAALLYAASVVASIVSTLSPRDSNGQGTDSYGTGREGSLALVELLSALKTPVERSALPPSDEFPTDVTLVLIAPSPLLVRTEPEPLHDVGEWVERGGRVLVAPGFAGEEEQSQLDQMSEELEHFDADILSALGLEEVRVELMLSSDVPDESPHDDAELVVSRIAEGSTGPAAGPVESLVTLGEALPEVTYGENLTPRWETRILDADGDERVLAAAFARGAGEIVVIADSTLLANVTLPRGDNAAWLVRLLLDRDPSRIVIDEFYHGLSVRGNAWWLLTRLEYAAVALCGLLLLGVWTWRKGVLLGPPLAEQAASRRSMGEYIDAMGRLFLRGRSSRRFLGDQLRQGIWRRLCAEYGVPPASESTETLAAAIARRDATFAERVRKAFAACPESPGQDSVAKFELLRNLSELSDLSRHTPTGPVRRIKSTSRFRSDRS